MVLFPCFCHRSPLVDDDALSLFIIIIIVWVAFHSFPLYRSVLNSDKLLLLIPFLFSLMLTDRFEILFHSNFFSLFVTWSCRVSRRYNTTTPMWPIKLSFVMDIVDWSTKACGYLLFYFCILSMEKKSGKRKRKNTKNDTCCCRRISKTFFSEAIY